ncbi:MAG: hypothetical protein WC824_13845 [Bacteroidota bacterium]|jgi:hypothetical protein
MISSYRRDHITSPIAPVSRVLSIWAFVFVFVCGACEAVGQVMQSRQHGEQTTIREIEIDNWNIGLIAQFGEIFLDEKEQIQWRDHNPNCGARRIDAEHFGAMPYSSSKSFILEKGSTISFLHGLGVGSEHPDSIRTQFPAVNFYWRMKLAVDDTEELIATLDSISIYPPDGYDKTSGFHTPRLMETLHILFGEAFTDILDKKLKLVLDCQPIYLDGMDYNFEDSDVDGKYSDQLDELYGYSLLDTIRQHGARIFDVSSAGYGTTRVDFEIPEAREYSVVECSQETPRIVFKGQLPAGYSRLLVRNIDPNSGQYELRDQQGSIVSRMQFRN